MITSSAPHLRHRRVQLSDIAPEQRAAADVPRSLAMAQASTPAEEDEAVCFISWEPIRSLPEEDVYTARDGVQYSRSHLKQWFLRSTTMPHTGRAIDANELDKFWPRPSRLRLVRERVHQEQSEVIIMGIFLSAMTLMALIESATDVHAPKGLADSVQPGCLSEGCRFVAASRPQLAWEWLKGGQGPALSGALVLCLGFLGMGLMAAEPPWDRPVGHCL